MNYTLDIIALQSLSAGSVTNASMAKIVMMATDRPPPFSLAKEEYSDVISHVIGYRAAT